MTPVVDAIAGNPATPLSITALVLAAMYAFFKAWPQLKQTQSESDASLREDLLERVKDLESQIGQMRLTMTHDREQYARERELLMAEHDSETRLLRHQLAAEKMTFDNLFVLLEAAPDKVLNNLGERIEHRKRIDEDLERKRLEAELRVERVRERLREAHEENAKDLK